MERWRISRGAVGILRQAPLSWMTQAGGLSPLRSVPTSFAFPRFSPDGRRLAMTISDGRESDIWVYDWERETMTRVTTDPGLELSPVWNCSDGCRNGSKTASRPIT